MIGLKLGKSSRLPEVRGRELYNVRYIIKITKKDKVNFTN